MRCSPLRRRVGQFAVLLFVCGVTSSHETNLSAGEFSLQQHESGVVVKLDGQLFTEYLIRGGTKPILWPIIGPSGVPMTRAYPMKDAADEKKDHPHQRSLWFTHGIVNGIDFWSEPISFTVKNGTNPRKIGSVVHREFIKVAASGARAEIVTVNDWLDENGKKQCEDQRTLVFTTSDGARSIDFDVVVKATDGPVLFGDTKEGSLGVRVPSAIDVKGGNGHIVNSEGLKDVEAWGKPARWVDYSGTIDGKVVGIAILNHPSSFRHPTTWHVRDYGLFAANPFGLHDFDPKSGRRGDHTIQPGESLTLRHRIVFHTGDSDAAKIAAAFDSYAAEKK